MTTVTADMVAGFRRRNGGAKVKLYDGGTSRKSMVHVARMIGLIVLVVVVVAAVVRDYYNRILTMGSQWL